jgi:hypothetical protein
MESEPKSSSDLRSCPCADGQCCQICLGSYGGLLLAAVGGEQDLSGLYRREPGVCDCQGSELCRTCAAAGLQDLLFKRLGDLWRQSPTAAKQKLTPLDWLALTADRN